MNNMWDETMDITEVVDKKSYLLKEASEFEKFEDSAENQDDNISE